MNIGKIKRVISVCEIKDILVWKIASVRIVRNISAESYQLICPDLQVDEFRMATHTVWEIVAESQFTKSCTIEMIRKQVTGENLGRVNWLFQQFAKINAITLSELADEDVVLIWDADTLPLRQLNFFDQETGRLRFYHSKENHEPYFQTIEQLLGFGRKIEVSFIAQCFPVRVGWVRSMISGMESQSRKPYVETILSCLPGNSGAEFSEYETMGTWLMHHHAGEIEIRKKNRWLRCGSSFLPADPSSIFAKAILKTLSIYFDFVAIENWKRESLWKRILNKLQKRFKPVRSIVEPH